MTTESTIEQIDQTLAQLIETSFKEKRVGFSSERSVNQFLDTILDLKATLQNKSDSVNAINRQLEALTWLDGLDEQSLTKINEIISLGKDLRTSLLRFVSGYDPLAEKEVAQAEITTLKESIDDLKEDIQDLESRFFFLPQMPDFVEADRQLSLV